MSASNLMWFGGLTGLAFIVLSSFLPIVPGVVALAFACGALFGKGYGIWESRRG
jgi:hypothetical protein